MLESEDVYERQNAAVVFGFYMLEEFYQGLASGYTMVLDRLQLESGVAHDIDSWPAYKDTWDRLTLIRTFVNAIPSVMPVSRLEGVLRILLLYEAVVVIDPREFALRRTADPGVSEVLDLWWEPYWDWESDDEIAKHVQWSLFELTGLITRLQHDMIGRLNDEVQRVDAARAIIRLYSELLWTRKQNFGNKIKRMQSVTHFVDREDGETTVRRDTKQRHFSDFLSAIPVSPVEQGYRAAVEFLKNELAFRSDDDDEVTRAMRILLSTCDSTL